MSTLTVGTYVFDTDMTEFDPGAPELFPWAAALLQVNPSPRNWPVVVMHADVDRIIELTLREATNTAAYAELALIKAACVPGATLTYSPDGETQSFECAVLTAEVTTPKLTQKQRLRSALGQLDVQITLRTTPYWLGPEVEVPLTFSAGSPFEATIAGVPGDVPALTRLTIIPAQATSMLAASLRSNPGAAYATIEDYDGVADADAFGGECTAAYHGTSSFATLGTPGSIDVGDNRGPRAVYARVKTEGAVADTLYRAVSTVTPSVGDAQTVYGDNEVHPATTASGGFDVLDLGIVPVPAGRVQAGLSGMAYGNEHEMVSVVNGAAEAQVGPYEQSQTFEVTETGQLTGVSVKVHTAVSGTVDVELYRGSESIIQKRHIPAGTGWVRVPSAVSAAIIVGETLRIVVSSFAGGTVTLYRSTAGAGEYAGGNRLVDGDPRTDDLVFKVHTRPLLTMGASIGVQEKCTTADKDTFLDVVCSLPTDEWHAKVTKALAAEVGYCFDYMSENQADHDIYSASATATGTSLIAEAHPYKAALMLRPGTNVISGIAAGPVDEAPGNVTGTVRYRARYTLPFTGV